MKSKKIKMIKTVSIKQALLFFLIGVISQTFNAQTLDLNAKLPVDERVKKGVLPNGMTYYIKSTDVVKDAASYYIIQKIRKLIRK